MSKNNWPYGKELLSDEIISSLSDWSDEKEYVLGTMDQVYDYRWDIRDNGKVIFTDRVDETDVLAFDSLADTAAWLEEREIA